MLYIEIYFFLVFCCSCFAVFNLVFVFYFVFFFFFFFKQKTAYEMDGYWSSDVCSSDLIAAFADQVLEREWELPFETPRQMMVYTVFQELSTGLNYKNLRRKAIEQGDKALATALSLDRKSVV